MKPHWRRLFYHLRLRRAFQQSDFIQCPLKVTTSFECLDTGPDLSRNTAWQSCERFKLPDHLLSFFHLWHTIFMPLCYYASAFLLRIAASILNSIPVGFLIKKGLE